MNRALLALACVALSAGAAAAQDSAGPRPVVSAPPKTEDPKKAEPRTDAASKKEAEKKEAPAIPAAISRGVEVIMGLQEGEPKAEWPYEGVYRVGGKIPIGYRVGGTGISALALLHAPGYAESEERKAAVAHAVDFVCGSITHELMNPDYDSTYDVRGWGYTYGLELLLRLKAQKLMPKGRAEAAEKAIAWFIKAIEQSEIPEAGGWNYSRPGGKLKPSPPSPFMTGPTLQVLFEAKRQGYAVDEAVVTRALDFLQSAHTSSGAVVYSGKGGDRAREATPGAVGRMLVTETTLFLAGRSNQSNIRAAIDAFIVHWSWLDQRRAKDGTHKPPYMIAPYYFYYAHYYAAQAVEQLPQHERAEYRRRINDLLFSVRLDDGSWNDRVFPRSANFGTAMATMALMMPELPKPAKWAKAQDPK
jgi:hypothetical protein